MKIEEAVQTKIFDTGALFDWAERPVIKDCIIDLIKEKILY